MLPSLSPLFNRAAAAFAVATLAMPMATVDANAATQRGALGCDKNDVKCTFIMDQKICSGWYRKRSREWEFSTTVSAALGPRGFAGGSASLQYKQSRGTELNRDSLRCQNTTERYEVTPGCTLHYGINGNYVPWVREQCPAPRPTRGQPGGSSCGGYC